MGDYGSTKVIQITNIAPQATRDQMHTLFNNIGKIEDLRLYPSVRDASIQIKNRCCFLKFLDPSSLQLSLHMTNTVFIDRAIVVQPFVNGDIPDEWSGLEFANSSQAKGDPCLPPHVSNVTEGDVINTVDPSLEDSGLPSFPPLPAATDIKIIEEIRRTVSIIDIDPALSAQAVIEYFGKGAGEVKYFRWCTKEDDERKMALIEFTDYGAVIPAMRLNDTMMGERMIKVFYATQALTKPQAKSNEMAQREIEEAMKKVKEAQNLVSDAVNPLKEWLGVKGGRMTRSRTRSPGRDYYSRDRHSRRRSRSRDRYSSRRRSRSRRRSKSRSRKKRSRSRKRSRSKKKSRSKSKDRKSDKKVKSEEEEVKVKEEENGDDKDIEVNGKDVKEEKRSKSRERKRSRSRDRKKSKSRERRRSRSRSRKKTSRKSRSRDRRSRSRDRKKRSRSRRRSRSRSRDKKRRSRSRSRDQKHKKSKKSRRPSEERDVKKEIKRDYDAEEAGFENANGKEQKDPVDMEISNSP